VPEQGSDRFEGHASVDRLGRQRMPQAVRVDVTDSGRSCGFGDSPVDTTLADSLTVFDEQVGAAQTGRPGRHPLIEQLLQLRVQGDVAVGAQLAERHVQPVRGADLHDGVDGEVQELALAQAGAGEELHRQPHERVRIVAGGLQQFGERAVVKKTRQRLVTDRHIAAEDQHRARHVAAAPLGQALEACAQGTEGVGLRRPSQLAATGRGT
jgi:hypothetical protein